MKRLIDIMLSTLLLLMLSIPMVVIGLAVRLTSTGPAIHWSKRIGRFNKVIAMPKFRTMHIDSPDIATHLMDDPKKYLTPIGSFLRKTSLDEVPQLWSVFLGDMSLVGPRPALFNQHDLVTLRTNNELHKLRPGLTGLAQIKGRDHLSIEDKVDYDLQYNRKKCTLFDMYILLITLKKIFKKSDISH